jgi:hypothetical protein
MTLCNVDFDRMLMSALALGAATDAASFLTALQRGSAVGEGFGFGWPRSRRELFGYSADGTLLTVRRGYKLPGEALRNVDVCWAKRDFADRR